MNLCVLRGEIFVLRVRWKNPQGQSYNAATEVPAMNSPSTAQPDYTHHHEPRWSDAEKKIARAAFDAALHREIDEVVETAKQRVNALRDRFDIWNVEEFLTRRRHQIDKKYDYRYSQLTTVFGRLLYERRITEENLHGLHEDKLQLIHNAAEYFRKNAA